MPRESQYVDNLSLIEEMGYQKLGSMTSWAWHDDPKHLLFTLSRYKFVAKMFDGFNQVLEVGCGDGFPARIVAQSVHHLTATDFDEGLISTAQSIHASNRWNVTFEVLNPLQSSSKGKYDGIYALDVLEHIAPNQEFLFMNNIIKSLQPNGSLIIGMPSLESQQYASEQSKRGHVNCKTQMQLRNFLKNWFHQVFIFSMNDEVVHTGYAKMAHYEFALCCSLVGNGL